MSATNRGLTRRAADDNYPTPAWCVHRLLEAAHLPAGRWLEPTAGSGAIVRAVRERLPGIEWTAVELRPECRDSLEVGAGPEGRVVVHDLLTLTAGDLAPPFDVAITNPPYALAQQVIERCLPLAGVVAMLLRLNFLASRTRAPFMRSQPPDVYVLPDRPSFTGGGRTDSIEYAWFVWPSVRARQHGELRVLAATPVDQRRS
jgi:hypothetical protein